MAATEEITPLSMIATRLTKAFETAYFRRLGQAGYGDLRTRHAMLLELLPKDGARPGVLAAQLGMTKQTVAEIVDDLESAGYIRRIDDPVDRRARLIVLDERGIRAHEVAFALLDEMDAEFSAIVGADRYAAARATFVELIASLEATPSSGPA